MDKPQRFKLKLTKLDFLSAVDAGAQGPIANAVLLKRAGEVKATFKVAKTDDALGLVFGWAFASSLDGGATPHTDLQWDQVDDDFLKAAMEFIEGGGATDVMHDGAQDGRVVFAFPLLPDICKALGIASKTLGLAVAIKPSAETFKRFQSGELAAFSIAGLGERTPVTKQAKCKACTGYVAADDKTCPGCGAALTKRAIHKQSVLTSTVDGHAHSLDANDPATYQWDGLSTSYQTAEGADSSHSHAWAFDPATGAIVIAADSGHTHTVDASVPPAIIAGAARIEVNEQIAAVAEDAVPASISDEPSSGKTVVVIAARAPAARESTRTAPVVKVTNNSQENTVELEALKKQLAESLARIAHLQKMASLTDAQRAHHGNLGASDAEAFLAKSVADRDGDVSKALAADPVVYTTADGIEIRKSAGDLMVTLAKRADDAHKIALSEIGKREDVELAKRADVEIGKLGGTIDARKDVLKAIDGISDAPRRTAALAVVKSGAAAMERLLAPGNHRLVDGFELPPNDIGAQAPTSPTSDLRKYVEKYQVDHKVPTYEQALAKALREDPKAAALYNAAAI